MFTRIRSTARTVLDGFSHLIYPKLCWVCERFIPDEIGYFCQTCRTDLLTDTAKTCPRCSSSVGDYVYLDKGCVHCRDTKLHFEQTVRLGPYEGLLRDVVLRLKHSSGELLAEVMGKTWAETRRDQLLALATDVVIPIPLHPFRRLVRGYNQAERLARMIANELELPCRSWCLQRARYTSKQAHLPDTQRAKNVKHAFRARTCRAIQGKTVLLVDDVLTTGHTASEAARALKQAGANRVCVAVLAHWK